MVFAACLPKWSCRVIKLRQNHENHDWKLRNLILLAEKYCFTFESKCFTVKTYNSHLLFKQNSRCSLMMMKISERLSGMQCQAQGMKVPVVQNGTDGNDLQHRTFLNFSTNSLHYTQSTISFPATHTFTTTSFSHWTQPFICTSMYTAFI